MAVIQQKPPERQKKMPGGFLILALLCTTPVWAAESNGVRQRHQNEQLHEHSRFWQAGARLYSSSST